MNKVLSTWFKRYFSQPEAIALIVIIVMGIFIFKIMGQLLAPIIISVVVAYLLFGIVNKLKRWHCPHILAVLIAFTLFIGLFLLLLLWLLPLLWEETVNLVAEVPVLFNRGQTMILKLHDVFPELVSVDQLQQVAVRITTYLADFGKEIVTFSMTSLFGIVTITIYLVLVPLLVFFFLRDGNNLIRWFAHFLPEKRQILQNVWRKLLGKIRCYIQGKIFEVVIVAIVTIVAFEILGLRYAVLLGALVGLSVIVPYVGIVIVTIPVVIVGLIQWGLAEHFFYLMMVYIIISILDANLLVPILFSEVMNLHPLAIILGVLVFGNLFGFWGIFFAIPLLTMFSIIVEHWPEEY